ncbi:hypothetical protein L7F22_003591 [Adiantum nelumboides]|nr:hypothetical protein [Adiantum nelumboides]
MPQNARSSSVCCPNNYFGENVHPALADKGYGASTLLVIPYKEANAPGLGDWRLFNRHLSRGRVVIENVFGIMKNRWRILRNMPIHLYRVPTYVIACCVLHNFLMEHVGDEDAEDHVDPHPNNLPAQVGARQVHARGQRMRNIIFCHWRACQREMGGGGRL